MATTDIPFRPSDATLAGVVEQSAIAIVITDAEARVLYVNPAFSQITGYAAAEVLGQNQSFLSYKATPREVYVEMWRALRDGHPWSGRLLNRRKNGEPYVAELTVTRIADPAEGPGGACYLGMHRDATAAHRLERELHNQRSLIESVVAVAPVAVALLDSEGHAVLDNPAYQRVAREIGVAEPARAVITALQDSLGEEFATAMRMRRALLNQELRFDGRAGRESHAYACSLSWFQEHNAEPDAFYAVAQRDYMLLVMHDISARRRQDEALRLSAMRAMLSEGELTQSLREALSGAIFQLQGPVNLIAAAAGLQKRRAGEAGQADPLIQALAEAQAAGEAAIATLQAALPPESSAPVGPVNLNEVLHDVLMLSTESMLAAGVSVDWRPAHVLPSILGEPTGLRTLFRQILDNAVEAMNVRGCSERAVTIVTEQSPGYIVVEIADTGPGIPEGLRLKVFEPFYSTKQGGPNGARGVGLSLAQDIVRRHRGVIEIDAPPGGGCRLRVTLPTAKPANAPNSPNSPSSGSAISPMGGR